MDALVLISDGCVYEIALSCRKKVQVLGQTGMSREEGLANEDSASAERTSACHVVSSDTHTIFVSSSRRLRRTISQQYWYSLHNVETKQPKPFTAKLECGLRVHYIYNSHIGMSRAMSIGTELTHLRDERRTVADVVMEELQVIQVATSSSASIAHSTLHSSLHTLHCLTKIQASCASLSYRCFFIPP